MSNQHNNHVEEWMEHKLALVRKRKASLKTHTNTIPFVRNENRNLHIDRYDPTGINDPRKTRLPLVFPKLLRSAAVQERNHPGKAINNALTLPEYDALDRLVEAFLITERIKTANLDGSLCRTVRPDNLKAFEQYLIGGYKYIQEKIDMPFGEFLFGESYNPKLKKDCFISLVVVDLGDNRHKNKTISDSVYSIGARLLNIESSRKVACQSGYVCYLKAVAQSVMCRYHEFDTLRRREREQKKQIRKQAMLQRQLAS